MKIKWFRNMAILAATAILASCAGGAVVAPPVDLPAPITGRITISEPDGSGNVTIKGTAGAVTADSMVMAVNEEISGPVSMKLLDLLIKNAYAESEFPDSCFEAGKGCAISDSEGAFEIIIKAENGDSIVIGVVDPDTATFISDLLRRTVGENPSSADCSEYDVNGETIAVVIDPVSLYPVLLKKGSSTGTNQILVGNSSPVAISIDGCFAYSIDIIKLTNSSSLVAVTSREDGILWTATLTDTSVSGEKSYDIDGEPMHLKFLPSKSALALSFGTSEGLMLGIFSLDEEAFTSERSACTPSSGAIGQLSVEPIQSLSMSVVKFGDTNGTSLGTMLANDGDSQNFCIEFFNLSTLSSYSVWDAAAMGQLDISQPAQVKAFFEPANKNLTLGILQSNSSSILGLGASFEDKGINYTTALKAGSWIPSYYHSFDAPAAIANSNINSFTVTPNTAVNTQVIIGVTDEGSVFSGSTSPQGEITSSTLSAGTNLIDIAAIAGSQKAFAADATSGRSIDASTSIW